MYFVGLFVFFFFQAEDGIRDVAVTGVQTCALPMIVVTGLSVRVLIFSRIGCPHPGFFVSTTTTPLAAMNMAVFPPPPRNTYRLSRSLSTSTTLARACPRPACCYAATDRDKHAIA